MNTTNIKGERTIEHIKKCLENKLSELENIEKGAMEFLQDVPKGTLYVNAKKNSIQYLYRIKGDSRKIYIKKDNKELVEKLAQKEYTKKILKTICKQIKCIKELTNTYSDDSIINIYENMPDSKKYYIEPYERSDDDYAKRWEENNQEKKKELQKKMQPYKFELKNTEEGCEIFTEKGEQVRSKSEKILADKLNIMGIPYVYEMPLYLKGFGYVKPDFFILNKRTRREYYFEHFGLMDNEIYCNKAIKKIETYGKNKIFLGKKLIVTFETGNHPININNVENIIKEHLI